jgi:voltage-gated potassium channel
VLVLEFESASPDGKIVTGGDALWYSMVTITTVGYGDYYPITPGGRLTAVFIMVAGMGIIGVLASLMFSLLLGGGSPAPEEEEKTGTTTEPAADPEITALIKEVTEMHQLLEKIASIVERKP